MRPPKHPEQVIVIVWDPERSLWLQARDRELRRFALLLARLEHGIKTTGALLLQIAYKQVRKILREALEKLQF